MKVLVVDDIQIARSNIKRMLARYDIDVVEAHDGITALKVYKEEHPNIICLDIDLPGEMDGMEILKQIKNDDPNANVIMLSAMNSQYNFVESFKAGASYFLVKPIDLYELVDVIKSIK